MDRKFVLLSAFWAGFTAFPALAVTTNFTINTSAVQGRHIKVVIDVTANTLNLNSINIFNFAAPGSTMGLPDTQGGLITGDLILITNPAASTNIQTGFFFNEIMVNLNPVGSSVTFTLSYTTAPPPGGVLPDEISVSFGRRFEQSPLHYIRSPRRQCAIRHRSEWSGLRAQCLLPGRDDVSWKRANHCPGGVGWWAWRDYCPSRWDGVLVDHGGGADTERLRRIAPA